MGERCIQFVRVVKCIEFIRFVCVVQFVQSGADLLVVSPDFHFDFVHTDMKVGSVKATCVPGHDSCTHPVGRNVTVKGVSEDVLGMSGEPEETSTDAAEDADEETVSESDVGTDSSPQTEESADAEEGLQEDDFVRIAYTARTVDEDDGEGMLVDTTDEEIAEEEGVADEGTFEPRVIILGAGHIVEPVEEEIIGGEVGTSGSVTVPPSEAFGEYDEDEIRTVSADKISEDDRYPGAQVQIEGEQGYLETIYPGRARVDFNHPLAGEEIEYEFEVLDVIEDDLERAQGFMNMVFDFDLDMRIQTDEVEEEQMVESDEDEETEEGDEESEPEFETVTTEKETLYIEATPQLSMNQQWLFQKQQIAQQLMDQIGIDRVIIEEIIDGQGMGMGMPGMMGMGGGAGGGEAGGADIEEALEDADVDADEILDEIDEDIDEESVE